MQRARFAHVYDDLNYASPLQSATMAQVIGRRKSIFANRIAFHKCWRLARARAST